MEKTYEFQIRFTAESDADAEIMAKLTNQFFNESFNVAPEDHEDYSLLVALYCDDDHEVTSSTKNDDDQFAGSG